MSWNHPNWQDRDKGPGFTRGKESICLQVNGQTLPFSSAMSGIFSFLIRSDYTADSSTETGADPMFLWSIGYKHSSGGINAASASVFNREASNRFVQFRFYDESSTTNRYIYSIGDEDGVSWLSPDKWYYVAFSATATEFRYAVNGSVTPKVTVTDNTPGALNLLLNGERWWWGDGAGRDWFTAGEILNGWSSLLRGPAAFDGRELDLSSATVRDRIFDSNGALKHPGENGSLWFNDTYTTESGYAPHVYQPDGGPRMITGSSGLTFETNGGGGAGFSSAPGALKKAYE
jgi:hypothetical protein